MQSVKMWHYGSTYNLYVHRHKHVHSKVCAGLRMRSVLVVGRMIAQHTRHLLINTLQLDSF